MDLTPVVLKMEIFSETFPHDSFLFFAISFDFDRYQMLGFSSFDFECSKFDRTTKKYCTSFKESI